MNEVIRGMLLGIATGALVVIAVNTKVISSELVTLNTRQQEQISDVMKEKVLPVVGRVTIPFDGLGADVGFLVKDGEQYSVARYGALIPDTPGWEPKYITKVKYSNGQVSYAPLLVDSFD